jgi:hypothetical protein
MRPFIGSICILLATFPVFAQSDRGVITGTVSDPAGAVIAGAMIEVKNGATGAVYQAGTSATGNYTLPQLPAGQYDMSVTSPGFKKYVQPNVTVDVAQTYRVDVVLQIGLNTESVTVTEAVPLLKTDSGELSHNVTTNQLDALPVLTLGSTAGQAGIRNPYAVLQVLPGGDYRPDVSIRVNGMPSNTQGFLLEGQDTSNSIVFYQSQTQPSVDAIQEFAIQTSNYAAEFGQAGGGVFNVTMKSGTNQFHGSGYEYFVNEALNAGVPFTNDGTGHLLRPRDRMNDYGFTLGGPVWLPKIYNGHDKLFFFFSFEQFRQTVVTNNVPLTVPTPAYREGDFEQALTGRDLGTDALGRPIMENTIYDPASTFVANGLQERNPFPNNTIPASEMDPVALKIQSFIPMPSGPGASGLINDYLPTYANPRLTYIPSVKVDYLFSSKSKLSGYWSRTATNSPNTSGLPYPITTAEASNVIAHTIRLNFDQTLTPTLLLHFGGGLLDTLVRQLGAAYNPVQGIGLTGTYTNLFPGIGGLSEAQGGGPSMGSGGARLENLKPTGTTSLTWVRNNHTYKAGAEIILNGDIAYVQTYANGNIDFAPTESGLPSLNGVPLAGTVGFSYASFLLGAVDNGYIATPTDTRMGAHSLAWYVQDTWKANRKLTIDYGLRYDFETYLREQYGRFGVFSPTALNPSAGNLPGAVIYEATCHCHMAHNYPFAFGPRLGIAYQIQPKTVFRGGVGVSYYKTDDNNYLSLSTGSQEPYDTSSYGNPAYYLRNGLPFNVTWPNFNPGIVPLPGETTSPSEQFDQNAGRPARTLQWSLGLQREVTRDLAVEAAYVANRGVWWNAPFIINPNILTPQILAAHGLSLNNPADLQLLAAPINSSIAAARGFSTPPYPEFPLTATVAQSLRPFPQFGGLTNFHYSPDGDTWYQSLQAKANKRFSHGLDFASSFTWSKQEMMGVEENFANSGPIFPATNDITNRPQNKYLSGFDQPFLFTLAANYTTPRVTGNFTGHKVVSWIARDWTLGAVLRYASGLPIESPIAQNGLSAILSRGTGPAGTTGGTFMDRVPGVPLFTHNLNCGCFDPTKTFVLNPAAWADPPAGQFGTAAGYYDDYRYQRRPVENMSLGRVFRIKESKSLQIRAEFTNIFNRTEVNNPTSTNALATQTTNAAGQTTGGFGFINNGTTYSTPRQGQLVARFQF